MSEKILVTGCAGFIGMHLCKTLLNKGYNIFGVDNLNSYYSVKLKKERLDNLLLHSNFEFEKIDITNYLSLKKIIELFSPSKIVNLAAQAGVRHSIKDPHIFIKSNIAGFMNILELSRYNNIEGLIYASSSSVYGEKSILPFSEDQNINSPISIYAVSKIANEHMARTYSSLFGLRTTGLRFFTVYGPWGRPDMAIYKFTEKILSNKSISVYNHGNVDRDFTYIDDIVAGIVSSLQVNKKCRVYNLGNKSSQNILKVVSLLEKELSIKAKIKYLEMQSGDVKKTFASIKLAEDELKFSPKTSIDIGLSRFIEWYKSYHNKT
jgi:UDP-glucuronate 4-epimerase